jgi:hypothetical protein
MGKLVQGGVSEIQIKVYSEIVVSGRLDRTLVTDTERTGSRSTLCARTHHLDNSVQHKYQATSIYVFHSSSSTSSNTNKDNDNINMV